MPGVTAATTSTSSDISANSARPAQLSGPPAVPHSAKKRPQEDVLPIDSYKDEILYRIARDPVTIIYGETGCGKSSRLPIMLLRHAQANNQPCRMMVSQPRRIAVSSLYKRVKESLGDQVGMRMGHGVREESPDTKVFFVTTGYLVRLLAHKSDAMRNHTHIIVDEVHERSVDGDVVCLLVRRLLLRFPHIKVVLMSATIHTDLYRTYFSVECGEEFPGAQDPDRRSQASILDESEPEHVDGSRDMRHCVFVGSRRFPLDIRYLESLNEYTEGRADICCSANKLMKSCTAAAYDNPQFIKEQHALAVQLISKICTPGSSLLVFVSGMTDIIDLTERLGSKYHVIAIHSEIPFEEQEAAFLPTAHNEVKIILATNAAESSITLPDVDDIICLGMHKTITYDLRRHRSVLRNAWISKASATQRAGRTGRVRPGRVFRLYTRQLFTDVMTEYGEPEILRVPLQETILNLRVMLETSEDFDGVVPLLEDMLEPPDVRNVQQSFENLYEVGLIDEPSDEGALTPTGRFVGSLPVGIVLGRLIAYAVMLGVEAEGAILAAALSLSKSPFRIASPLVHKDPAEYNDIVQRIFLAASAFDRGMYSEPLMLVNLLLAWRAVDEGGRQRDAWVASHGVVKSRIKYFDSVAKNLADQVSNALSDKHRDATSRSKSQAMSRTGVPASVQHCSPQLCNTFRLILLWTNVGNNLLKLQRVKSPLKNTRELTLSGSKLLTTTQLESLFPPAAVPFRLTTTNENMCVLSMASSDYLSQSRSPTRLQDILIEMLTIAATNAFSMIPVVWLKVEMEEESEDTREPKSKAKGGKKKALGGCLARVSYAIAMLSTLPPVCFNSVFNIVQDDVFSPVEVIPCSELRVGGTHGQKEAETDANEPYYRVFRVELFDVPISFANSSVDKALCACFSTLHVQLSFANKIKVICKNCQVSVPALQQVFHYLTPGDVVVKKSQIAAPSQCLEFLPEPHPQSELEGGCREFNGLVDDVALGVRLYKAYLSGLKNGKG